MNDFGIAPSSFSTAVIVVVKFLTDEKALVPPAFEALTRQKYSVLKASGPICFVVAWVESSRIILEKFELVDTCIRYEAAPVEANHSSIGVTETPVAPSAGDSKAGAAGARRMVVKVRTVDHALVPPAFLAFTRHE